MLIITFHLKIPRWAIHIIWIIWRRMTFGVTLSTYPRARIKEKQNFEGLQVWILSQ